MITLFTKSSLINCKDDNNNKKYLHIMYYTVKIILAGINISRNIE